MVIMVNMYACQHGYCPELIGQKLLKLQCLYPVRVLCQFIKNCVSDPTVISPKSLGCCTRRLVGFLSIPVYHYSYDVVDLQSSNINNA